MKINLHTPIEEAQVQIIPLIDVIFCILTFFLLAALQFTRQQAINVDLPKANTGTPPQFQSRLIVTLDSAGQIFVEKNQVALEQLPQNLRAYLQANPLGIIVLNASRSSSYNDVIQLLDAMREVGGDRVALATVVGSPNQPDSSTIVPGTIPNNSINPLGNPTPTTPAAGQFPFPGTPGQSLSPQGNNFNPTFPTAPARQPTLSPGNIQPTPQN